MRSRRMANSRRSARNGANCRSDRSRHSKETECVGLPLVRSPSAPMKLCACEHNVPGATFDDRVRYLASVGVEGVELTIGEHGILQGSLRFRSREVAEACARTGVRPTFVTTQIRDLLDADPALREAADAQAIDALRAAAEMGAMGITLVPRFGPSSLPDLSPYATPAELEHSLFIKKMAPLADEATRLGVKILIEPLNRYLAKFLNKVSHAKRICAELGRPSVGILIDNFQSYYEEVSIGGAILAAGDELGHVHISENTRRLPPQGSTDFTPIFAALKKINYQGYLSFECDVSGGSLDKQFADAVAVMRSVR